jgi:hypothetical protein
MPVPVKVRAPRPATPAVAPLPDTRRPPTAMDPGPADVVRARTLVGNAAVTAAMGGLPRGADPNPAGWRGQMLLAGQNLVGNQAVATQAATPVVPPAAKTPAQPQGLNKATAPPTPKPDQKDTGTAPADRQDKGAAKKEPAGPGTDPKFQALKKDITAKKKTVGSSHPPAKTEAGAAQAASVPPADDREARGKAAHAEDMDAAQPKEFTKTEFVNAVQDAIAKRAPKNLDEADKFGESGKADEVKAEVQGKVGEGKEASAKEIADTTAAAPQPAPDAKEVVPLTPDKVPGKPGTPNPNQAVPDPLPPSATDMSAGPAQVDQQMADAQVTEPQLKKSNEPTFDKALTNKKAAEQHSATAPAHLRAGEAHEFKQVKTAAATKGATTMAGMQATRVATGQQVGKGKAGTKTSDEDKRTQVTALLQKVFDQTKCDVEKILSDLDKKVDDQFTDEEKRARDRFTAEHTDGMNRYKEQRYSGFWGKARWVKDLFADLPEEANRIYERAKDNYLTAMRQVISDIADTIDRELRHAKDRIAAGRKELKDAVDKLPIDLRAMGREAATDFEAKFDELKDTVNDKGTELVDTLATRYTDAVKSVDDEIAAEKERNKGLVSKAAAAVAGVIRTIKELGSLLMGVLRKAVSAIGAILKDPIGFLGNLVTGVGGGLKLFMKNAGRHLEQGVLAWLLGTGMSVGFELPTSFDTLGILLMLATLLGLSWPNIRTRLVRKVHSRAITSAEVAIPLVAETKKRGVAGMWAELKTRVGDLKKELISNLVSFLLPTIIIAGVTWILSLFNPASAFIRACKMIIDIIRFIVTQGRQILEFVNTVLDAVIAIARGGTGGVPALVERALARSIPILIGALAAILGIGGLAGKVKQIFQKLARPVNRAIDWVIDKITGLIKNLWAKLKDAMDKRKRRRKPKRRKDHDKRHRGDEHRPTKRPVKHKKDERSPARRQKDLMAALHEAGQLADRTGAEEAVRHGLPAIRARHHLSALTVVNRPASGVEELYVFEGVINPRAKFEHLAVNRYLRDATRAFKDANRAFAINDMPGPMGEIVPGLVKVLRLSDTQSRKYAEVWVTQHKLTRTTTARGRVVYSFVHLTDVHLRVPFDHPERQRWMDGAAQIHLPTARASRLWYQVIAGLRDRNTGQYEIVAAALMENMRLPPKKGALWSKGEDLSDYAVSLGFTTLEAQEFYKVTKGLVLLDNWPVVRPVWKAFSERYAGQLRKEINIFLRQYASGSVLVDIELPAVETAVTALGKPIGLKYHGMEWGDDPLRQLTEPIPGYWRELRRDGKPLLEGQQQILDQPSAAAATEKAKQRFLAAQAVKRHRHKTGRK